MATPKTVVIGLDGAHFELIQPWLDSGELPNIKQAIDKGVSSDLESVLPPVTSPNWKAYATGKNPGKLGIFWWENVDIDHHRVYYPTERKNEHTEFWELIGETQPVGVLGVPTTYPPKAVNGFLVSGAPDGDNSGFTYPETIENELVQEYDYSVRKRNRLSVNREEAIEEILDLIDTRFSVGKSLAEDYNVSFLQITTFYLNSLHHFLWDNEATLRGWKIVDEHIGSFLDGNTNLVLMSDHGSTEIKTVFNINTWLEQEGYLSLDPGVSKYLYKAGITTDRLVRLAYLFRIPRLAEQVVPEAIIRKLPNEDGGLRRESKTDTLDWQETSALASGQGPVYLTIDSENPEYERIRSEIIKRLEQVRDPTGRPIANRVLRGEDIYSGPYLHEAPDIVIDQTNGIHIDGAIGQEEVFTTPEEDEWRAENKRQGLFIGCGPDFGYSAPEQMSILDLAPMLLHLHGSPIPKEMDGNVPKTVFADGTAPAERDIEYATQSEKREELRRIRKIAKKVDI